MVALNTEIERWEPLIDCFRGEIEEYGGLLHLLVEQQQGILDRDSQTLSGMNARLELQTQLSERKRAERSREVAAFARECGLRADASLRELVPMFPEAIQPMLTGFIDEVQRLIDQISHKARQNNMLLSRACELTGELIDLLSPETGSVGRGYGRNGRRRLPAMSVGVKVNAQA